MLKKENITVLSQFRMLRWFTVSIILQMALTKMYLIETDDKTKAANHASAEGICFFLLFIVLITERETVTKV